MSVFEQIQNPSLRNAKFVFLSNIYFYGFRFKDDNIFFTALIAFTLKNIFKFLDPKEQEIAKGLLQKSENAFEHYRNKNGKNTYNFYPTTPVQQYSGIPLLRNLKSIQIPDDLDDTVLIEMAKSTTYKTHAKSLKNSFEQLSSVPVYTLPKPHQQSKAYRSWMATKMKNDVDICVVCNVLIWASQNKLTLSAIDKDSIQLVCNVVKSKNFFSKCYLHAPHYKNPAIVLYHITRCIVQTQHPQLLALQKNIIAHCEQSLQQFCHPLEKIILYTSLHQLGKEIPFDMSFHSKTLDSFYWFKANPFSIAKPWVKKLFSRHNFLHLQYQCTAYNWILILEFEKICRAKIQILGDHIYVKSNTNH